MALDVLDVRFTPESGHRPAGISEARGRPALRDDWGQNRADQPRQT